MKTEYPLQWIRFAACQIYGRNVSDSAFRRWLRVVGVKPWCRTLTPEQSIFVLTYAYLRKTIPNQPIGIVRVKQELKKVPYTPERLAEQIEEGMFCSATGRDMPHIIRQHTGKSVSLRTLYRWAKQHDLEFGISRPIPKPELEEWFKLVS